ncbi:MAG: site-2 protease family protein [Dehalococcoidia bacterium]
MIFRYTQLLEVSPVAFFAFLGAVVVALLVGISFHELSHALVADNLGDPTPRRMGRVSLNPMAHLDPAGTVILFLAGFGWGKPVPINPMLLRNGPRLGSALVAAAGPGANLVVAALAALPINLGLVPWRTPFLDPRFFVWDGSAYIGLFLSSIVIFGIILAIFNLIPLAPLDGFRVAAGLLPRDLAEPFLRLEQYGIIILLLLLVGPLVFGGPSILFAIMEPAVNGIAGALSGVEVDVFG